MKLKITSLLICGLLFSTNSFAETYKKSYTIKNELNKEIINLEQAVLFNKYGADTSKELVQLADFYAYNEVYRDTFKAYESYELAAIKGNEYARMMVGYMTLKGYGVEKNMYKGLDILKEIKEPYQLNASFLIGKYELEHGNTEKAISIFKKVKDPLSYTYLTDILIEQDRFDEVIPYLQWLAVNQNDSRAKRELGKIYLTPKYANEKAAIELLSNAGKSGDAESQYQLGLYYHQGTEKTVANIKESVYWYKLAAQNNHSFATQELLKIWNDNLANDDMYGLDNDPYLTKILQGRYAEEHYHKD